MPRSRRAWLINGLLIAFMAVALVGGEKLGGRWVYVFPVYLLVALALGLLYRRQKLGRENGPRSG
jgi:hypothetical protein